MPKHISIDNAQTILSIIGEEDSIGLDKDAEFQAALTVVELKVEALIESGEISAQDILVTFE